MYVCSLYEASDMRVFEACKYMCTLLQTQELSLHMTSFYIASDTRAQSIYLCT